MRGSSRVLCLLAAVSTVLMGSCGEAAVEEESRHLDLAFNGVVCDYGGPATLVEGAITVTIENDSGSPVDLWIISYPDSARLDAELDRLAVGDDTAEIPEPEVGGYVHYPVPSESAAVFHLAAQPRGENTAKTILGRGHYTVECGRIPVGESLIDHQWRAAALEVTS